MGVRVLIAALALVFIGLQYRLWLSDDGVQEVSRLRTQIEEQQQENERLRERNRTLAAEVQDLKKGTTAIEERARTDLGMIGKSETFYQVVAPRPAASQNPPSGSDAAARE
jgi:cell division protein FtsB